MLLALIPALPAFGALVNGVFGVRWFGRRVSGRIACTSMGASFVLGVIAFVRLLALPPDARVREYVLGRWIPAIPLATEQGVGAFHADWSFRLDPLSAVMVLIVTGIGLLIHIYSLGYMRDEPPPSYARFFCYLNLFCALMLVLVLAANFLVMFIGWEGVGLSSYLLIGFWYEKDSAANAGRKAFIVNRVGDWAFLVGLFMVFWVFGSFDFRAIAERAAAMPVEAAASPGPLTLICLLLFAGATGKSAQIPLFVWLPDAMEGPTPVSALIHASTMVTAGVYVVARNAVLFSHAPAVLELMAATGVATAFMAATIAVVQTDIKRVLAYSTVSQLGYMFLAAGVGAFGAAIFHLFTHAFFKALLFLGSGSVIHAMAGEQNMQRMGGLRKYMPITFAAMLVGTLAIAGVPPLSGFFSKDEILLRTLAAGPLESGLGGLLLMVSVATALLTAFYMGRLMLLTFAGAYRGPVRSLGAFPSAAHELPWSMRWPLVALAAGAAVAGFAGVPAAPGGSNTLEHFLAPSFMAPSSVVAGGPGALHVSTGGAPGLMLTSVLAAVAGLAAAWHVYVSRPGLAGSIAGRVPHLYRVLRNQYYVDQIYGATFVAGTRIAASEFWRFDRRVIDGAVDGSGWLTQLAAWISHMADKHLVDGLVNRLARAARASSFTLRRIQTGLVQNYALMIVAGIFAFLTLYLVGAWSLP